MITICQRPNSNQSLSKSHTDLTNLLEKTAFNWSLLNKRMNTKQSIPAEKAANEWLAENGLCAKLLLKLELEIQQAQLVAHNLLKHHTTLLNEQQLLTLKKFLKSSYHYNTRIRLNSKQAYKILNIGTAINRKVFKQLKQLQALTKN